VCVSRWSISPIRPGTPHATSAHADRTVEKKTPRAYREEPVSKGNNVLSLSRVRDPRSADRCENKVMRVFIGSPRPAPPQSTHTQSHTHARTHTHRSSRLVLNHAVRPFLVQNTVPTLAAPDDVSLLDLSVRAAVTAQVRHCRVMGCSTVFVDRALSREIRADCAAPETQAFVPVRLHLIRLHYFSSPGPYSRRSSVHT
jgi:hypothetical protein